MARHLVFALILLAACSEAFAALSQDRDALVTEFAQAMELEKVIAASKDQVQTSIVEQGDIVIENLANSGLSEGARVEVRVLYDEIMKQVMDSWTAQEATRIYSEEIATSMSDNDLRSSIAFYESVEGRRSLSASGTASVKMQAYIQTSMTEAMRTAMADFMEKMKAVAAADLARNTAPPAQPPSDGKSSESGS
jgi:hypothetical protein